MDHEHALGGTVDQLLAVQRLDDGTLGMRHGHHRARDQGVQHGPDVALGHGHGGLGADQLLAPVEQTPLLGQRAA